MAAAMRDELLRQPATLFLVGAYHIGKERAIFGAAQALGLRVWCSPAKRRVLGLLDLPAEHTALLADNAHEAQLHVCSWGLQPEQLEKQYLGQPGCQWEQVVGFRPTGWTSRRGPGLPCWREGRAAVYGVPYSEHSSWADLRACVAALRPRRIVPTVGAATPAQARAVVDRFADLMDLRGDRSRLDRWLLAGAAAAAGEQVEGVGVPGAPAAAGAGCSAAPAAESAPAAEGAPEEGAQGAPAAGSPAAVGGKCSAAAGVELLELGEAGEVDLGEQRRIWEAIQRENARRGRLAAARQAQGKRRSSAPAPAPPPPPQQQQQVASVGRTRGQQQQGIKRRRCSTGGAAEAVAGAAADGFGQAQGAAGPRREARQPSISSFLVAPAVGAAGGQHSEPLPAVVGVEVIQCD
jgi:DNA cross-link repair 1A protein